MILFPLFVCNWKKNSWMLLNNIWRAAADAGISSVCLLTTARTVVFAQNRVGRMNVTAGELWRIYAEVGLFDGRWWQLESNTFTLNIETKYNKSKSHKWTLDALVEAKSWIVWLISKSKFITIGYKGYFWSTIHPVHSDHTFPAIDVKIIFRGKSCITFIFLNAWQSLWQHYTFVAILNWLSLLLLCQL